MPGKIFIALFFYFLRNVNYNPLSEYVKFFTLTDVMHYPGFFQSMQVSIEEPTCLGLNVCYRPNKALYSWQSGYHGPVIMAFPQDILGKNSTCMVYLRLFDCWIAGGNECYYLTVEIMLQAH